MKYRIPIDRTAYATSPFVRREWIEIICGDVAERGRGLSPFVRREWIEMFRRRSFRLSHSVSLREKGVD